MSGITIYGVPGSPFLRAVEVTLKEKDVAYDLRVMSPMDSKSPEHLRRHPFGRIPVFECDGLEIYETQAIIRYLDEAFPNPPLTPGNAERRARMNQIIGVIECYFFPKAAAPIAFQRIIGPALLGQPTDEAPIAEAMPMARTSFEEFDRMLSDKPYLTGDSLSLADIMLASLLDLLSETPEGRELMASTRLLPWLNRMRERPSFQETQPPAVLRRAALAA